MTPAEIQQAVRDGINAVKRGEREHGRALLLRVVQADEGNEPAWLWLSGVMDDPADQLVALENALALNPHNTAAQTRLHQLRQQLGLAEPPPPAPPAPVPPPPPAPAPRPPALSILDIVPLEPPPAPRPTLNFYTPPPPQPDAIFQCIYCGQPTRASDITCPHCHQDLMTAGEWKGMKAVYQRLLVASGLVMQMAVLRLGGAALAWTLSYTPNPVWGKIFATLPFLTALSGSVFGWEPEAASWLFAATLLRGMAFVSIMMLFYNETHLALEATLIITLLDVGWTWLGYAVLGYFDTSAALTNVLLDGVMFLFTLVALLNRRRARARQWVEIDKGITRAASYFIHGREYAEQGKWALAIVHWERAVSLKPTESQWVIALAEAQIKLGREAEALNTVETGLANQPTAPAALRALAQRLKSARP